MVISQWPKKNKTPNPARVQEFVDPIHNISSEDLRDKALTENLLLDSTRILESLLNHMPAGIAILEGPDLRYVNINQNLADLNGLPVEDHLGKPLKEVLPDAEKNLLPVMHKIMKDGKAVLGREFSITLPNNPDKPSQLMDYLFPIPDKHGKPIGVGVIVLDVTERKKTVEELQISKAKYRSIVEDQTEMIVHWKPDGTRTFANNSYCKFFGLKKDKVVGSELFHIQSKGESARVLREIAELTPDNPVREGIYSMKSASGSIAWVFWKDRAFFGDGGNITEIQAVGRDETDRVKAEDALSESEEKYLSLVENLNVGIYILQDNKFTYVNETFEKILGYKLEEVSLDSFNFMDLVAPESKEFILQRAKLRNKGEKTDVYYVFKGITKTGNIVDLEANTSAIEFDGKPAVQGLLKDVTTQMQDRRDKLILQEKLKQSERMESLGLLAGGVAHDLNNIIGPIMVYPDLIRMDLAEGKSIDKDLNTIMFSAQRAADVIADLLALTRRGNYKMKPIDLNDLVSDYLS